MSIVFFGTPLFAVPSLKALLEAGERISAVVTKRDMPKGRGKNISPPPVKEAALLNGLRVIQPLSMKEEGFLSELSSLKPEFIAVVAYGKILTPEILSMPSIAPVNLHASLLPSLRGASPIAWAIINGETETGVTTMIISEGLDEGDILLSEKCAISDNDTAESLSRRLSEIGAELLVKTIRGMRDGSIRPVPQAGTPTYAPRLKRQDGLVDWRKSAKELSRFLRGLCPWPGAFFFVKKERIILLKARPVEGTGTPGRIEKADEAGLVIGTSDGLLSVLEVQPEGKKPMGAGSFLAGRSLKKGDFIDGV